MILCAFYQHNHGFCFSYAILFMFGMGSRYSKLCNYLHRGFHEEKKNSSHDGSESRAIAMERRRAEVGRDRASSASCFFVAAAISAIAAAIAVDPSFLQSESEVRVFFSYLFSSSLNWSLSLLTPLTLRLSSNLRRRRRWSEFLAAGWLVLPPSLFVLSSVSFSSSVLCFFPSILLVTVLGFSHGSNINFSFLF